VGKGEGVDGPVRPAHGRSLRMTMISTGISLTSFLWKEKGRIGGAADDLPTLPVR
jgi:hypothetical protein